MGLLMLSVLSCSSILLPFSVNAAETNSKTVTPPVGLNAGFVAMDSQGQVVDYSDSRLLSDFIPEESNPLSRATQYIDRGRWDYSATVVWGGKRGYSGFRHPNPHSSTSKLGSSVGHKRENGANVWSNAYSFGSSRDTHYAYYNY